MAQEPTGIEIAERHAERAEVVEAGDDGVGLADLAEVEPGSVSSPYATVLLDQRFEPPSLVSAVAEDLLDLGLQPRDISSSSSAGDASSFHLEADRDILHKEQSVRFDEVAYFVRLAAFAAECHRLGPGTRSEILET
ncbi:MAG TPA: hypothetical protein DCS55_19105 [Acidimicrobiaceae bacterium]|nr:hypothetical protein [Acidimicrobiaceae bacterium]